MYIYGLIIMIVSSKDICFFIYSGISMQLKKKIQKLSLWLILEKHAKYIKEFYIF